MGCSECNIIHLQYFVIAMKTIGYSNLLILENIIFTFEYFSIKDALNNLGDYWPTHTKHESEQLNYNRYCSDI